MPSKVIRKCGCLNDLWINGSKQRRERTRRLLEHTDCEICLEKKLLEEASKVEKENGWPELIGTAWERLKARVARYEASQVICGHLILYFVDYLPEHVSRDAFLEAAVELEGSQEEAPLINRLLAIAEIFATNTSANFWIEQRNRSAYAWLHK